MNAISTVLAVFCVLGALDYLLGNRFGLGKEFEKAFMLMGTMVLSMLGMLILVPLIARLLEPMTAPMAAFPWAEPSVIAGLLLAPDMGGAPLAAELAGSTAAGQFNGIVVASMMGTLISFTLPLALGVTRRSQHPSILLGLMCGMITVPIGCAAAGVMLGLSFAELCRSLVPLVLFSAVIAVGLLKAPELCLRIFGGLGKGIKVLIIFGLVVGLVEFLTDFTLLPHLEPAENAVLVVFNAACVMSGAFPLLHILGKVLNRPLRKLGSVLGINEKSALGFMASLATNVTTFGMMDAMDDKGVVLNSAFAVSAAFVFAGQMAFTMAFDASCYPAMMVGKLISGVTAVAAAELIYRSVNKKREEQR